MRTAFLVSALLFTLLRFGGPAMAQSSPAYDIVPHPASLTPRPGAFDVTAKTVILYPAGSAEMRDLAQYLSDRLAESTGKRLAAREGGSGANAIVLALTGGGAETDESYSLNVAPTGITISAPRPAGVFYGVQSLRQMAAAGGKRNAKIPAVSIQDAPRYSWRGMSFDCARHFVSKEMVKRYIDLLAYHKMNVFHWHLTDDQGWRIEIKKYPKLTGVGAWRDEYGVRHGGFYTQEDAREVVAYARSRYITVVPEIEMPGHGTAALAAYPELSCTGEQLVVKPEWGVFSNLFCAGKEGTFTFLEDVLKEVMAVFPSPCIHIGGDEADKSKWKTCPLCQKRIRDEGLADEEALQGWFSRRMDTFIRSQGRIMIGWDEILAGKPSQTAIVESWRGMQGAVEGAAAGHRIISAPSDQVYFDYAPIDERIHTWWMPIVPVETTYAFQATPKELTAEQAGAIMGAECAIWTERVREYELDYKIFPRLGAFS
jgi:hexosaminidase